jgi:hypothetical protein
MLSNAAHGGQQERAEERTRRTSKVLPIINQSMSLSCVSGVIALFGG